MATIAKLLVGLGIDARDYEKGLDKAEEISKGFGSKVASGLSSALKVGLAATAGGVIGAIGAIVKGVASNAEFERYKVQFGVLLGSTEAAQKRLEELARFGATTPFELPEVVRADKILQGFGLHSEEAAKKFKFSGEQIRTIAGDVASGTGAGFEEMSLLIGKFATGATGEAISRMAELGITSREELSKLGLAFSKSGELTSPLPQALTTVLTLMQNKFGGMMQAQSMTFEGMVSNLQDWIGQTLRLISQPIFEVLKDKLSALLTFLGDPATVAALQSFADSLARGVGFAMDFLANKAIPELTKAWESIAPVIGTVSTFVTGTLIPALQQAAGFISQNLEPILAGLAATIGTTIVGMFTLWASTAITAAAATITALLPVLVPIAAIGLAVGALYYAWQNNLGGIQEKTAAVIEYITPYFEQAKSALLDFVDRVLPLLQNAWDKFYTGLVVVAVALYKAIEKNFDKISTAVESTIEYVIQIVRSGWNLISGIVEGVLKILNGDVTGGFTQIYETVKRFIFVDVPEIVKSGMTATKDVAIALLSTLRDTALNIWENIKGGVYAKVEEVRSAVSAKIEELKQAAIEKTTALKESLLGLWQSIYDNTIGKVAEMWNKVIGDFAARHPETAAKVIELRDKLSELWEAIKAKVTQVVSDIWDHVVTKYQEITTKVSGEATTLKDNVTRSFTDIYNSISKAVTDTYTKVKEQFDLASAAVSASLDTIVKAVSGFINPIIEEAKKLGQGAIDGIIKAIDDGANSVVNSLVDTALGAIEAAADALLIHSPSEYAADKLGRPTVDGVMKGYEDRKRSLAETLGSVVTDAVEGANGYDNGYNLAEKLGNGFLDSINRVSDDALDAARKLVDRIGDIWGKIKTPSIGDTGKGGKGIKLPGFANGVRNFAGGLALVGERGPEILRLPRGSDVLPGDLSTSTAPQINNSMTNNIQAYYRYQDEMSLADELRLQQMQFMSATGSL